MRSSVLRWSAWARSWVGLLVAFAWLLSSACDDQVVVAPPEPSDAAGPVPDGSGDAVLDGAGGVDTSPTDGGPGCTGPSTCPVPKDPCQQPVCLSGACTQADATAGTPCDDGNPCTGPDACQGGVCLPGTASACDDGNVCTADSCVPSQGCQHTATFLPCSDGDACTQGDTCQAGACLAGKKVTCDDGLPCTLDVCQVATGCATSPASGPCDDGSACTSGDACQGGTCVPGPPVDCDDGQLCTTDSCVPASGCTHGPASGTCSDDDPCTGGDACQAGACVPGPKVDCGDGNPCTTDSCGLPAGCTHTAANGPCSDGNACTLGEACAGGVCSGGTSLDCDDGNPCTTDACLPSQGCSHLPASLGCEDGDTCTLGDACLDGKCASGKAMVCSDGNPCTSDSCAQGLGCQFLPTGGGCDDGNACTKGDACQGGVCAPGDATVCDDGNPCTTDGCLTKTGCVSQPSLAPCDDGDACTTKDGCSGGLCVGGKAPNCDDGNACTQDLCDPGFGCLSKAGSGPCSDGNVCTTGDSCGGGVCLPGAASPCDDGQVCTTDACSPTAGCGHTPNTAPCSDGSVCTLGDTCAGGACSPGVAIVCDDGNPCTLDACDPKAGCTATAGQGNCKDLDECTVNEACTQGKCVGQPKSCDDGSVCTVDACDSGKGCFTVPVGGPCNDGDACTSDDACALGKCGGKTIDCDDGNPCSIDSCSSVSGCKHVAAQDFTACGPGVCTAGACVVGTEAYPATTCLQAKQVATLPKSGVHWLDPDGPDGKAVKFQAYCDMETDGGGWTLLLKVDGKQATFEQKAALWQDFTAVDPQFADLDDKQARLPSYGSVPFQALRIGMKEAGQPVAWITVPIAGSSLGHLIEDGKLTLTSVGRATWKKLVNGASLQANCSQEGINTLACRIGITANQENDCASPDSWLGIGCSGLAAGNYANGQWQPDNGGKLAQTFAYVLAR